MKKTLGGDRLGTGNKMQVNMHEYGRSTHDLGYIWRSTMAPGTLVPFMKQVAQRGDTFDINLNVACMTHPTLGPLFGRFKIQLDVFLAPWRLYQAQMHNNELGIGLKMNTVKLPVISMEVPTIYPSNEEKNPDLDNAQVNPSCIWSYLGIRGIGLKPVGGSAVRSFNAIPYLAYWDIYKNYYANKQEEEGQVIHNNAVTVTKEIKEITYSAPWRLAAALVPILPNNIALAFGYGVILFIHITGFQPLDEIIFVREDGLEVSATEIGNVTVPDDGVYPGRVEIQYNASKWGDTKWYGWRYSTISDARSAKPEITTFLLSYIDDMRNLILQHPASAGAFEITTAGLPPYILSLQSTGPTQNDVRSMMYSMEGLGLKTYNSDLFNNWLNKEWIEGVAGINEITAVSTAGGEFKIDALILANKVYQMLNRIAISDGTYQSWLDTVYTTGKVIGVTTPMYMGGLIKELAFQEVISNSDTGNTNSGTGVTGGPLGTLAGKGVLTDKHKGGKIVIHVDEPSYIMGIVSITPLIDYSQGNDWDINLKTMDDPHKPAMDEIGFQDLVTEQMAWWDTWYNNVDGNWEQKSAGKQPAWLNYMTNVNKTYGNFAIKSNEMFMTLNRRYESIQQIVPTLWSIADLTTYINPVIYNNIFAETALDAQNFWMQIGVDIEARRIMSAKLIPNL